MGSRQEWGSFRRSRSPLAGRLGSPVSGGARSQAGPRGWRGEGRRSRSRGGWQEERGEARRGSREEQYEPGRRNMKIKVDLDERDEFERRRILMEEDEEVEGRRRAGEDEFDLFVGGLHGRLGGGQLAELFSSYGRVTKAEPVKSYGFVNILTVEERAMAAVADLSGSFHHDIKLFVQFRKGSKYEHLNVEAEIDVIEEVGVAERRRQGRPSLSEDGIVIVDQVGKGTKALLEEGDGLPDSGLVRLERFGDLLRKTVTASGDPKTAESEMSFDGYGGVVTNSSSENEIFFLDSFAPKKKTAAPSSADLKLIMATIKSAGASLQQAKRPPEEGPKAQRKMHVSGLNSRICDLDLKELFGRYGEINRVDSKINYSSYTRYGFIFIFCSELTAVRCVCELSDLVVKGAKLKVTFMRGSYEDTKEFKEKWAEQMKEFTSPSHRQLVQEELGELAAQAPKIELSQIGAGLSSLDMSLSLEPLHPSYRSTNPFSELYSERAPGGQYGSSPHTSAAGSARNLPPPMAVLLNSGQEVLHLSDIPATITPSRTR